MKISKLLFTFSFWAILVSCAINLFAQTQSELEEKDSKQVSEHYTVALEQISAVQLAESLTKAELLELVQNAGKNLKKAEEFFALVEKYIGKIDAKSSACLAVKQYNKVANGYYLAMVKELEKEKYNIRTIKAHAMKFQDAISNAETEHIKARMM